MTILAGGSAPAPPTGSRPVILSRPAATDRSAEWV